jgi:hypothetical protein
MRFSIALDSLHALRPAPERERAPAVAEPAVLSVVQADPLPDELDQRVRQLGEWQLEDW